MIRKTALASLCLALSANTAFAACAGPRAEAALKIASLQQRLMVAGLACHAADDYNRFVLAHRAELQRSDDDLKAWFIANGGEAGYDTYKTRLANVAAHGPATDQNAFCAATSGDFRALAASGDLLQAAAAEPLLAITACEAPQLVQAAAPVRVARNDDATRYAAPMSYGTRIMDGPRFPVRRECWGSAKTDKNNFHYSKRCE